TAADRGQLEPGRGVDGDVTARHRATEDGAERHERVADRRRLLAPREQPVGEVLHVRASDLRYASGAQLGPQTPAERHLVRADGAGVVPVPGAIADASFARADQPRVGRLAQSQLTRRAHRPAPDRRLRLCAPRLRLRERGEGLLDPLLVARAPDARLVARAAV